MQKCIDLEHIFKISQVKACLNAHGKFYIVANKRHKTKGLYLLDLDENDLDLEEQENFSENDKYLIKWSTQLDLGDVDIFCIDDKIRDSMNLALFKDKFKKRYNSKISKQ